MSRRERETTRKEEEGETRQKWEYVTEREVSTHSQKYALIQLPAACAHSLLSVSSVSFFVFDE